MSELRRLFLPAASGPTEPDAPLGTVALDDEEYHYATRVLRLADGAGVLALDGDGRQAPATLVHGKRSASVVGAQPLRAHPALASERPVHLAVAAPKGERADWLVEKATELGVATVCWVDFARSVAHPKTPAREQRFLRVARAAARQARHGRVPKLQAAASLSAYVESQAAAAATRIVVHPGAAAAALVQLVGDGLPIRLVVGPEGGLDPDELQRLQACGYARASLGPHILRVETAALVAIFGCGLGHPAPGVTTPNPS